jgi:hypothetical protein
MARDQVTQSGEEKMIKEYKLREELDQAARDIALYSGNPSTWLTWIKYLLTNLENQALDVNPVHQEYYEEMLSILEETIHNRLSTGGW